mmetsp:Transcript_602/g.1779  ORF Transcript_602/g.1779 Transcript_602/m.1779 type:complete len:215 (+) Transcript_602:68-712(+)
MAWYVPLVDFKDCLLNACVGNPGKSAKFSAPKRTSGVTTEELGQRKNWNNERIGTKKTPILEPVPERTPAPEPERTPAPEPEATPKDTWHSDMWDAQGRAIELGRAQLTKSATLIQARVRGRSGREQVEMTRVTISSKMDEQLASLFDALNNIELNGQAPENEKGTPSPVQGNPVEGGELTPVARLSQAKELLGAGLIIQEEFDAKKRDILSAI